MPTIDTAPFRPALAGAPVTQDAPILPPGATSQNPGQFSGYSVEPSQLPDSTSLKTKDSDVLCPAQENRDLSLPAPDPEPMDSDPDFSDPQLRVNYVPENHIPLDKLVKHAISPVLLKDPWLAWLNAKPGEGEDKVEAPDYVGQHTPLDYIKAQLEERQRVEAAGGQFQFPPLMTCLKNMQAFIRHIREGQQFPEPLTATEAAAMARLEKETTALVEAQTPFYWRTLRLALSLMIACEVITRRQVLGPLITAQPELLSGYKVELSRSLKGFNDQELMNALPWTEALPEDAQSRQGLLLNRLGGTVRSLFVNNQDDEHLLLYPSFEPLTLEHFCRFGHMPLHPVGLITDYACNADGIMMGPLDFAEHDMDHKNRLRQVGRPDYQPCDQYEAGLCDPGQRLALRQLLLDQIPPCLAELQLKQALILLLFELLHEESPQEIARSVATKQGSVFFHCLERLTRALRQSWSHYSEDDRRMTDEQIVIAALWAARVWEDLQATDYRLTREQLQERARLFARQDVPRLQSHLDFLERHRGTVRQFFISQCERRQFADGVLCFVIDMQPGLSQGNIAVFRSRDLESGLYHLDNTDLAYLTALQLLAQRQGLAEACCEPVPQGTAEADHLAPESPVPGEHNAPA